MDQIAKAMNEAAKALKMDYGLLISETAAANVRIHALLFH